MGAQFLEASPPVSPTFAMMKSLVHHKASSTDEEHAPEVEIKPLPSSLRYEFLGPNSTYPVVMNANLNASQVDSLLRILRLHCKTMGYTLDDLKGIHSSMCMHRISIEDNYKLPIEHKKSNM